MIKVMDKERGCLFLEEFCVSVLCCNAVKKWFKYVNIYTVETNI